MIVGGRRTPRARLRQVAWCSSVIAMAAMCPGQAQAQCAPDPSQSGQAVTCSGTATGGYTIGTDRSPLTVTAGSTVQAAGDALVVAIPATGFYDPRSASITVAGSISSTGGNGILFTSGPADGADFDYFGTSGSLTIAAGGSVSGVTGITIAQSPGNLSTNAPAMLRIDNAGAISGTGGIALASTGAQANFSSITNEAGGQIGAIAASFNYLNNSGIIAGGAQSAIAHTPSSGGYLFNAGTISNSSPSATIAIGNGYLLTNSGAIANNGSGQAVSGTGFSIANLGGGTISASSGGTAINASVSLSLTNAGTIDGDVYAGSATSGYAGSSVDSSAGSLNGNLVFGDGNNTLVATLSNGLVQTGVSGTIIGGTGINTLQLATTGDATLSSSVTLPTNFTQLSFVPGYGTTLTLAAGFSNPGTIIFNGAGTLTNTATLSGTGQIVSEGFSAATFDNTGSISSDNIGGAAAIGITGYASLINSGMITATGDAVSSYGAGITNTGTISAGGTAVSAFIGNGTLNNSGSIISTGGTALILSAGCTCSTETNSGTISGAQVGVLLGGGILVNSGTITSPGYSIALNYYGTVENLVGGVISGGTVAIGNPNGSPGIAYVSNAGTIDGNVDLANAGFGTNTYYAVAGGILNGNLTLGTGDTLITDLVDPTSNTGSFAGITGTVNAANSNLVYTVAATTDTVATTPAGFGTVKYQLSNNPTLTFASASALTGTLALAGTGTVLFDGTIATTDAPALVSSYFQSAPGGFGVTTALAITNNGSIAATRTNPNGYFGSAVSLGSADTLVNNGTIAMTDTTGMPNAGEAALTGGYPITNVGTISGTGAGAVILNYGYGTNATLTNSGIITSDQTTIQVGAAATITNSGTIAATGTSPAIGNGYYYGYAAQITNLAGGVISASGDAIDLTGGSVSNAGTITGNVNLAYSPNGYPVYAPGAYYANGGTLTGNLTLGQYDALVIALGGGGTGPLGGVSGTIYANGAALVYTVASDATTTTVGLPAGFGTLGYMLSDNAALTIGGTSSFTGTLNLAGSGSVILDGALTSIDAPAVQLQSLPSLTGNGATTNALTVTNNGTILTTHGLNYGSEAVALGATDSLINNGTIGMVNTGYAYATVSGGAAITNTGTISGTGAIAVALGLGYGYYSSSVPTLTNSGTITSDQTAIVLESPATIVNSGVISSSATAAIAVYYYNYSSANLIENQLGGTITGSGDAIDMAGGTVTNAGTIAGNVNLAYGYFTYAGGSYVDNGGTLNGNLTLDSHESLITAPATNRPLGGVTGTIAANGAALIYLAGASATVVPTPIAGFGAVGYQLSNDAAITIASGSYLAMPLQLAGAGAVILDGTITTTDAPAVMSVAAVTATGPATTPGALDITNNGTISTVLAGYGGYGLNAVSLGGSDSFTNNGIVTGTGPALLYGISAVVTGGRSIANAGTITGMGLNAILLVDYSSSLPANINNSGQISSDLIAVAAEGDVAITNSGTISAASYGIIGSGQVAIVNSGLIYSATAPAISIASGSTGSSVTNLAGGVISGTADAIDLAGGAVSNAGTINGNVDLGYVPFGASYFPPNSSPGIYIANGGTLNGNLTFYSTVGGNELIETGSGFGVTGTIDSGGGSNYFGHLRTANATVVLGGALFRGFDQEFTVASGAATQVTIQGPAGSAANIFVGGTGAIVNQANTTGSIENLGALGETYYTGQNLELASFTNQATIGGIDLAAMAIVNSGVIIGNVNQSATSDTLINAAGGSIIGNIDLATASGGTGSIALAGAFSGSIDGGHGATGLTVAGGSVAHPIAFGRLVNIAGYTQTGGYATIAGAANLGGAAIDGGMLVGLVGSTITTPLLTVGAGGSFASGGTINGNVVVGGSLHVGASPDLLTVNGNVTMVSGSTSVFEVSHTASSKLVASGKVTIAGGTTLRIVQLQPLMPGTSIALIDAAGGISGSFSAITGISGQVLEHGDNLSLMALYDTSLPQDRQVSRSIAYVNTALVSGNAPAALFAALPNLTTATGAPAAAAFARLTPAPYASATQIGVENALTLSRAARDSDWGSGGHAGEIFTFGQALGSWRGLDGDAARGTATADISGYGFLGGLGLSHGPLSIAAFGGYLDQTQKIATLAASTHAKGFVGGATARLDSGPARIAVAVLYDDAHADTRRGLFNSAQVSAGYGVHSWSLDGEASTRLPLGQDWTLRPHIGATWVWTRRGAADETAGSIFALTVAADHHTAGYVDGGLRFAGADDAASRFTRFLDLGFRYQLRGRGTGAVAGFADGPIALFADGVRRSAASALVSAGGTYRVNTAVSLFMSGSGEMTRSGNSATGTAGMRMGF